MGWSTSFIVERSFKDDNILNWENFNKNTIEVLDINKTNLLTNCLSDMLKKFPDSLLHGNGEDTGWFYINLNKEDIKTLLQKEKIEEILEWYQDYSWGFESKKDRNEFKKEYISGLKSCLHFLKYVSFTKIYVVQG